MNVIRNDGIELAANANLFCCVDLALDLSRARTSEVEVVMGGVKVAGFTGGKRTFPAPQTAPRTKHQRLVLLSRAA